MWVGSTVLSSGCLLIRDNTEMENCWDKMDSNKPNGVSDFLKIQKGGNIILI